MSTIGKNSCAPSSWSKWRRPLPSLWIHRNPYSTLAKSTSLLFEMGSTLALSTRLQQRIRREDPLGLDLSIVSPQTHRSMDIFMPCTCCIQVKWEVYGSMVLWYISQKKDLCLSLLRNS